MPRRENRGPRIFVFRDTTGVVPVVMDQENQLMK